MTATLQRPVELRPPAPPRRRLGSLDALRGIAIGLMVFVNLRGSDAVPHQLHHSDWSGLTLADTVFPIFLFAVGASFALSARVTEPRNATNRAVKLVVIGSLLSCFKRAELPRPTFGVLQHIAIASLLACLLVRLPRRRQAIVVVVGLAALVVGGSLSGWGPTSAWGVHLDRWFGGYTPEGPQSWLGSVASIWFGVVAGWIVTSHEGTARRLRLLGWSALLLVSGLLVATVSPVNKPLWSPSFALLGAGIAAAAVAVLDLVPERRTGWARALGANPILTYVVGETVLWAIRENLWTAVRPGLEAAFGQLLPALAYPTMALVACTAMCAYLARRGIRVRV